MMTYIKNRLNSTDHFADAHPYTAAFGGFGIIGTITTLCGVLMTGGWPMVAVIAVASLPVALIGAGLLATVYAVEHKASRLQSTRTTTTGDLLVGPKWALDRITMTERRITDLCHKFNAKTGKRIENLIADAAPAINAVHVLAKDTPYKIYIPVAEQPK